MNYLFFDTETTGFDDAHIVQLAALLTNEARTCGEMNVLIRPEGWIVPAEATAVHGITTEDCEQFGIPIGWALYLFDQLAERADMLVAHNFEFDAKMLRTERMRLRPNPATFCTMQASTDLCRIPGGPRGYKWPKLQEAHQFFFNEPFDKAHDAMADVRACSRIFFEIQRRQSAKGARQ